MLVLAWAFHLEYGVHGLRKAGTGLCLPRWLFPLSMSQWPAEPQSCYPPLSRNEQEKPQALLKGASLTSAQSRAAGNAGVSSNSQSRSAESCLAPPSSEPCKLRVRPGPTQGHCSDVRGRGKFQNEGHPAVSQPPPVLVLLEAPSGIHLFHRSELRIKKSHLRPSDINLWKQGVF